MRANDKYKKLRLVPLGGLGNRIRVISSVYKYCLDNDIELICYWHKDNGLNASFSDIFESIPGLKMVDSSLLYKFIYNTPLKHNLYLPKLIDFISGRKSVYEMDNDQLPLVDCSLVTTWSVQGDFYPLNELFRPKADLMNIIESFSKIFTEETIGCHIRRTDNIESIQNSSTEKFENKFEELFSTNPVAKVYLCTDDIELKKYFITKYRDRILTYECSLSRNSAEGIRDAVVELWLLSRTKVIWGSYWSSFTDMAAILGNSQVKIIK